MLRWRLCDADWNHWPDGLGDEGFWAACAAEGFAGVELGVYRLEEQLPPARVDAVRRLAEQYDVPVAMLLLSLPAQRWPRGALCGAADEVAAEAAALATVAAQLGLDMIGVWPGADRPGADLVDGLARIVEAAAPVRVAVEYKPGTAVGTCDEALILAAAVPASGVLLDTGHAFAAGEDPAEVVRRLGDRLWHLHLGDADEGNADDDLPVGRRHDFGAFLSALADTGYAGAATLDLYGAVVSKVSTGVAAARESRAHLVSR